MADFVSARIRIGGTLPAARYAELAHQIAAYDLRTEWGGPHFDPQAIDASGALDLYAYDVSNGTFDDLEEFCVDHGLAFWRWSGGSAGAFDPEIVIFTGSGEPEDFTAAEDEYVVFDAQAIHALGSYKAIMAAIGRSRFDPPAFRVDDNASSASR